MAYIQFKDTNVLVSAFITPVSKNVIRVKTNGKPNISGFSLYLDRNKQFPMSKGEYDDYNTIYRVGDGWYELSNDGSVYSEPTEDSPSHEEITQPVITFLISGGGTLLGELTQSVDTYEELAIPTVTTEEGYEFIRWSPEIPVSGEIDRDMTFQANIADKHVYFDVNGNGELEGSVKQLVNDYSELEIPTPVADIDHKFTGWFPTIPTKGAIDSKNNKFYAFFESDIPDRIGSIESDLTDTQMALIENYNLSATTAEEMVDIQKEITDVQMALVEIYDLLMGGI
jgi:hypothetical protein